MVWHQFSEKSEHISLMLLELKLKLNIQADENWHNFGSSQNTFWIFGIFNKQERSLLQAQNSRDDHGKPVPIIRYHEFQPLYFIVIN